LLPAERLDLVLSFAEAPGARRVDLTGRGRWAGRLGQLAFDA
jgi:hypothetical protein